MRKFVLMLLVVPVWGNTITATAVATLGHPASVATQFQVLSTGTVGFTLGFRYTDSCSQTDPAGVNPSGNLDYRCFYHFTELIEGVPGTSIYSSFDIWDGAQTGQNFEGWSLVCNGNLISDHSPSNRCAMMLNPGTYTLHLENYAGATFWNASGTVAFTSQASIDGDVEGVAAPGGELISNPEPGTLLLLAVPALWLIRRSRG